MATKSKNYSRRKRNFKSKEDEVKKEFKTGNIKESKYNDASWYINKDQLAKDVGSLSFNTALGTPIVLDCEGNTSSLPSWVTLPGIMQIYTGPAVPYSTSGSSAINIAAKNLYSFVRHQNSGHSNYDSPDLMLYILAMDSVNAMIAYMQRIYGMSLVYSQVNRYYGDMLVRANGVNPDDIRDNLADFRAFINMYIVKASAFCIPNTMSLFKRHFWMYSNAFKDEETTKCQFYMYVPAYLWQYVETQGVGHLDPIEVAAVYNTEGSRMVNRIMSLAELKSTANALLNALQYSEDINIMSGDILKAYGRENLWSYDLIPEGYGVFPVYSQEILDQIHNSVFTGGYAVSGTSPTTPTASWDLLGVYQDTTVGDGALLYTPRFLHANQVCWEDILDIHSESPTPEEVLVSTRNMLFGTLAAGTTSGLCSIDVCGSDLCLWGNIIEIGVDGTPDSTRLFYRCDANSDLNIVNKMSKFNKYPHFKMMNSDASAANPSTVVGEIDNYTVVSRNDIQKMHESAMLSMLGVPTTGFVK